MSLCIIVTGQIRTFFDKGRYQVDKVIENSMTKYKYIHLIFVISGEYDVLRFDNYIYKLHNKTTRITRSKLPWLNITINKNVEVAKSYISTDIIKFNSNDVDKLNIEKIKSEQYTKRKQDYLSNNNRCVSEINDPDKTFNNMTYQFYQLKLGIQSMLAYEQTKNFKFDVVMKTRFDVLYHDGFYPKIPDSDSVKDRLLINDHIKGIFSSNGYDVTSNYYLSLLKKNEITPPEYTLKYPLQHYSLGGLYCSNYYAIEELKSNSPILYCFNDHVLFSHRDTFIILQNFFDMYGVQTTTKNIFHYYAQEAQLLIYCYNNNIIPVMYLHESIHTILR